MFCWCVCTDRRFWTLLTCGSSTVWFCTDMHLQWLAIALCALPAVLATIVQYQCDCGVRWENIGTPTLTSGAVVTTATVLELISYQSSFAIPVNSVDQAQWVCYHDFRCKGFVLYTRPNNLQYAYLFDYNIAAGVLSNTIGLDVYIPASLVYLLTRNEVYPCASLTLDPWFYYFSDTVRRTDIESTNCPYRLVGGACCWHPADLISNTTCSNPNPSSTDSALNAPSASNWLTQANAHWTSIGFSAKLPPNAGCLLTPTLWDSSVNCANPTAGCFEYNGVPCGNGRGFCRVNSSPGFYVTPNYCDCQHYPPSQFDGIAQYMGNACQYATREFCSDFRNSQQICSSYSTRCSPRALAGTSGQTQDYTPFCDCDSAPAVRATGVYCETNRCDTVYQCNGPFGGLGGSCEFNSLASTWECTCGVVSVGSLCQYSAASCKDSPSQLVKCNARGVCQPPGLSASSYPLSTSPNFVNTTAWCQCTDQFSTGIHCAQFSCDTSLVTAGRGQCDTATGTFLSCYPPFGTSALPGTLRCDIDKCALTGGAAAGLPPTTCDCGNLQIGNAIGFLGDITCYPKCPKSNGVVCGPAVAPEVNQCVYSGQGTTSHFATCSCGRGYIPVPAVASSDNDFNTFRPPVGSTNVVCEAWCVHGMIPDTWTPTNLLPCVCPNTGYNTNTVNGVAHPRCDNPVCQNSGVYSTVTGQCTCVGPYTSSSKCVTQTCDVPLTPFVEGVPGTTVSSPTIPVCVCSVPFKNSASSANDCSGNLCGPYGVPNPAITTLTSPADMCICSAVQQTTCLDPTGVTCNFCADSKCRNGGTIVISAGVPICSCPFPYTAGHPLCAADVCGSHGSPATGQCLCDAGWSGSTCATFSSTSPGSSTGGFSPAPSSTARFFNASSSSTATRVHVSSSTGVPNNTTVSSSALSDFGTLHDRIKHYTFAAVAAWSLTVFWSHFVY